MSVQSVDGSLTRESDKLNSWGAGRQIRAQTSYKMKLLAGRYDSNNDELGTESIRVVFAKKS